MFNRISRTLLCAGLILGSANAWAGTITGVTSPADLGANDSVDWGQLGPAFTQLTTPENWMSSLGLTGQVGILGSFLGTNNMERRDQGNGWAGNFTPGDHLLWNQGTQTGDGSIALLFLSDTISGFGANIQADFFGPFTATVTAFDSMGNVLGSFSEDGVSTPNGDGSAIFIGLKDNMKEIAGLDFSLVDTFGGHDMAINTVLLSSSTSSVPEPGSVAMLVGMGLSGAGFLARRRRK